jgi:TctA family transporter
MMLATILAILVPILTGYITKFLTNLLKVVSAFSASRPVVKQLMTFVISGILSIITFYFHTTDISVILNTVLGGALAQLFYNGDKTSAT